MNNQIWLQKELENGLILDVIDRTRRYFGDYFIVRLDIECPVPLERRFFDDDASFGNAASALRDHAVFRRTLERHGVPSAAVASVRAELVNRFEENALAYISSTVFPRKFLEAAASRRRPAARL